MPYCVVISSGLNYFLLEREGRLRRLRKRRNLTKFRKYGNFKIHKSLSKATMRLSNGADYKLGEEVRRCGFPQASSMLGFAGTQLQTTPYP